MKYVIEFSTTSAAFEDYGAAYEVSRILQRATGVIVESDADFPRKLYDTNGNAVGTVNIQLEDGDEVTDYSQNVRTLYVIDGEKESEQ